MLREALNSKLLVVWENKVLSVETRLALRYLIGHAATSQNWLCNPQWKGYLPDFRYFSTESEKWFFSFVPAQRWLLFYFRPPAIESKKYSECDLAAVFPEMEKKNNEWRVRVHNLDEAILLIGVIDMKLVANKRVGRNK